MIQQRWQDANLASQVYEEPAGKAQGVREGSSWLMAGAFAQISHSNYHPNDKSHTSGWFWQNPLTWFLQSLYHGVNAVYTSNTMKCERYKQSETERALADLQRQIWEIQIDNNRDEPPAENGKVIREFVGFIAHLAMEPGTADLSVQTRRPGETSKPECGND